MRIKTYTLTLSAEHTEKLRQVAKADGQTLSAMVRLLISEKLKTEDCIITSECRNS